ncbi:MAG TPA: hypothetical protein VMJ12_10350 [Candidatus Acidoferrales bacterium]|nr:hypothetical protein [Candidatus Acidoferrales bacterium]
MDFVKKHYEKVILSAVLLGVVGFLAFLPILIQQERDALEKTKEEYRNPPAKPLPPVDLSRQEAAAQRVKAPSVLDLSNTNRLFNPLEWQKRSDGTLFPLRSGNETGARAAVVTKIAPLYLIISFDSVETNGLAPRYVLGVERQAADKPAMRRKQQHFISPGEKKGFFILTDVKGDPADPDALVLKLTDGGDTVTVSKDKPFQRVEGYVADLKYDLDRVPKVFTGQRVGSRLSFGGEDYIVVAVDANDVILSAQSNQKKTTLPYAP